MSNSICNECSHRNLNEIKEILSQMPSEDVFFKLSEFFKAFSDPSRLKILQALSKSELCVCEISDIVNMTQSAVSHQLRFLKNIDILACRREGKSVIYSLKDSHIFHIYAEGFIHINEERSNNNDQSPQL